MAEATFKYGDKDLREGTPERPSRPRHQWRIDSLDPVSNTTEQGDELFLMLQTVVGSWVKEDGLEEYETVYRPRAQELPPIQRVSLKYLDKKDGSYRDAIRKEE